jgi:hypothetical protein
MMTEQKTSILDQDIVAINVGLAQFAENLEKQGVDVLHISWTPPAGGDAEMLDLLDKLL